MLEVIYAHQKWDKNEPCILLAGPRPRIEEEDSWYPRAIELLQKLNFNGGVIIPIPADSKFIDEDAMQAQWDTEYLERATAIAFWIPRGLNTLQGYTTNIHYGMTVKSKKIVLGYPPSAVKMRYLQQLADLHNVETRTTLYSTLCVAVKLATK